MFALVGAVGTPTAAATLPIATAAGAPLIGAFTGAESLRAPYNPLVMNVRASYFQETEAMVEHLTKDLGATKIAIMYQDRRVRSGRARRRQARARQAPDAARRRRDVRAQHGCGEDGAADDQEGGSGSGDHDQPVQAAAEFIKLARQIKLNATFVQYFLSSAPMRWRRKPAPAAPASSSPRWCPFPQDASIPVVARYQARSRRSAPDARSPASSRSKVTLSAAPSSPPREGQWRADTAQSSSRRCRASAVSISAVSS